MRHEAYNLTIAEVGEFEGLSSSILSVPFTRRHQRHKPDDKAYNESKTQAATEALYFCTKA
jgi:hypothetical protein